MVSKTIFNIVLESVMLNNFNISLLACMKVQEKRKFSSEFLSLTIKTGSHSSNMILAKMKSGELFSIW